MENLVFIRKDQLLTEEVFFSNLNHAKIYHKPKSSIQNTEKNFWLVDPKFEENFLKIFKKNLSIYKEC
jgi:hypothetical protein